LLSDSSAVNAAKFVLTLFIYAPSLAIQLHGGTYRVGRYGEMA
jgi:hypothetical protein